MMISDGRLTQVQFGYPVFAFHTIQLLLHVILPWIAYLGFAVKILLSGHEHHKYQNPLALQVQIPLENLTHLCSILAQ